MTDRLLKLDEEGTHITIARVFDAPRQLVWKEWTEPARLAEWFGGAESRVPLSTVSIDLTPGGVWTATTLAYGPERRDIRWRGEYLEVIEPERLAFTISGLSDEWPPDLVIVNLHDLGAGRTEMLFRQQGHRSPEQYELARTRWSVEFDLIAERVAKASSPR